MSCRRIFLVLIAGSLTGVPTLALAANIPAESPFTEHQEQHWSFQAVERPPVPVSEHVSPVDGFVAARLRE